MASGSAPSPPGADESPPARPAPSPAAAPGSSAARRWLPGAGTVALLAWLAWRIDLGQAWRAARALDPAAFAGLLALSCGFNLGLYTDRWRRTLRALALPHPFARVLRVHLGTGALRLALPIHAGEFVNAAVLARIGPGTFAQHVGAIAYLKFLNLIATCGLAGLGWAVASAGDAQLVSRTALASGAVLLPALLPELAPVRDGLARLAARLHPRLGEALRDLLIVYRTARLRDKLGLLAYSVVFQLSEVGVCHLLLRALGIPVSFGDTLLVAPVLMLVSSAPITVAGLGVREASALVLLAGTAPDARILAFGLCYSLIEYVMPLVVGLPWLPRILSDLAAPPPRPQVTLASPGSRGQA